ncbi:MAG: VOC family protein [Bacteroidales bacterium]|nr:VOC family protein [Bacteroidales bacterium]
MIRNLILWTMTALLFAGCADQSGNSKKQQTMPDSNGIIHIGVVVKDLEESLYFYHRILGMKEVREFSIDEDFGNRSGLSRGVPFNVKVLQLKEGEYSTNWKLMSFEEQSVIPEKQNIQDDIGVQYVTINVEKLEPYIRRLKENNIQLLGKTPVPLSSDRHFVLIKDPNGIFIELIGPME